LGDDELIDLLNEHSIDVEEGKDKIKTFKQALKEKFRMKIEETSKLLSEE
jgi:hypothetical protein